MKSVILTAIVLVSISSNAAETFFMSKDGKRLEATQALQSSLAGQEVMKCQPVEAKVSKAGTSITLRAIKKAKVK